MMGETVKARQLRDAYLLIERQKELIFLIDDLLAPEAGDAAPPARRPQGARRMRSSASFDASAAEELEKLELMLLEALAAVVRRTGELSSANFDEAYYLERHPDVAAAVREKRVPSGFAHWCLHGIQEKRAWRLIDAHAEKSELAEAARRNLNKWTKFIAPLRALWSRGAR